MKTLYMLIYICFIFSTTAICQGKFHEFVCSQVIDGDTIFLKGSNARVRLVGIDTPESHSNKKLDKFARRMARKIVYSKYKKLSRQQQRKRIRKTTQFQIQNIIKLGEQATIFVKKLLEGKKIYLEFACNRQDPFGRLLAYVYIPINIDALPDGITKEMLVLNPNGMVFVNASIVKAGYATLLTYYPNTKYFQLFKKLFAQARQQRRGLWQNPENDFYEKMLRRPIQYPFRKKNRR